MKITNIALAAPFAILLLLSAPAWSDEKDKDKDKAGSDSSMSFISVGLGYYNYSLNYSNLVKLLPGISPGDSVDSRSSGFNISGGWLFQKNLGLQFDLAASGAVTYTRAGGTTQKIFDPSIFSMSVLFWQDVSSNMDVYAKVGGTFWGFQSNSNNPIANSDSFGPNVGAGFDYRISGTRKNGMAARLEWNYYRGQNILVNHANSVSANLLFMFN